MRQRDIDFGHYEPILVHEIDKGDLISLSIDHAPVEVMDRTQNRIEFVDGTVCCPSLNDSVWILLED